MHSLSKIRVLAPALGLLAASCAPVDDVAVAARQAAFVIPPGARVVRTREALVQALRDTTFQGTIYLPPEVTLDLTSSDYDLPLRAGVTLLSQREGLIEGASLSISSVPDGHALFRVTGSNVRVEGLRIRGPSTSYERTLPVTHGIRVDASVARGVVVTNNELYGWPGAAVLVAGIISADIPELVPTSTLRLRRDQANEIRVVGNHIHHNLRDGGGYGVEVSRGAYATIEGNVFDFNRHAIASDGRPYTGYIAHFNYVQATGRCEDGAAGCFYNQHFDVHGRGAGGYGAGAGEYFDISYNAFRGEQTYYGIMVRPAVMLRGTPTVGMYFNNNVLVHDGPSEAVRLDDGQFDLPFLGSENIGNAFVGPNRYDVDPASGLVVGDFDGDGRSDVLLMTGASVFLSSGGVTSWRYLGGSPYRHFDVATGRFDGDARDDLFVRAADGGWYLSSGVTGPLTRINSSTTPMADLRFGDFNGDGLTDVFRADGARWWVSWSGRSAWAALNNSGLRVTSLRFGDFDGDGRTDVFGLTGGQWSFARSGQGSWQRLNALLTSDLASLAFADFDGDGKTDVAQRDTADGWRFSQGGATPWRQLRSASSQPQYANPVGALHADFDGDGADDSLRFDPDGQSFVEWSRRRGNAFSTWSRHGMR